LSLWPVREPRCARWPRNPTPPRTVWEQTVLLMCTSLGIRWAAPSVKRSKRGWR